MSRGCITFWILDLWDQITLCQRSNKFIDASVPQSRYLDDEGERDDLMIFGAHFYLKNRLINQARRNWNTEQTHGRQNTELVRCNVSEICSVELHIGTEKVEDEKPMASESDYGTHRIVPKIEILQGEWIHSFFTLRPTAWRLQRQ